MTDVACFCGCCYSFEGDGEACPRCGEYASIRPGPASASTGRVQQEPAPAANGAEPHGQPARSGRDGADSDRLPAGVATRS